MKKMENMDENKIINILDNLYEKSLRGIPEVSDPVYRLADDYSNKYNTKEEAAKALMNFQIAKCTTSGFVTGLGGLITLPVALPANVTSVLYVQLRMIAAIATIGGFDIESDQVKSLAYVCLTGKDAPEILKGIGINVGSKLANAAVAKIPVKVLIDVNKKVGFRLLTKFSTKGLLSIGKAIPFAGGIVGGAVDFGSTKVIAHNAYRIFIEHQLP